jgi:integrase
MGRPEIEAFLTHLAIQLRVSASTQNQALNAILFLYRTVLEVPLDFPIDAVRAQRPIHVPTVLSRAEVRQVLSCLTGQAQLMTQLLYGGGLRAMECARLRVKDLYLSRREIVVRDGKGAKDRFTILPDALVGRLQEQRRFTKRIHEQDLRQGHGAVHLPFALERKFPAANRVGLLLLRAGNRVDGSPTCNQSGSDHLRWL